MINPCTPKSKPHVNYTLINRGYAIKYYNSILIFKNHLL